MRWEYLTIFVYEHIYSASDGSQGEVPLYPDPGKRRSRDRFTLSDKLNELGDEGWELASTRTIEEVSYELILKRGKAS